MSIEKKEESFFDLIHQAKEMLLDRPQIERELIYHICKIEDDLRAAIILAYQGLKDEGEREEKKESRKSHARIQRR